ncbi:GMC family oxidoreductase [Terricaulis silvestris]|uniref:Choline dehydrogenase n=1 Tax=Terricaulis silvestris TaxID=2686094 RepID=A0A6I6MIW1_9CAUL|nr:GMC family oxidoreductase N-terminal domain-containing protein [Terricaulis silvestris]QGZ93731.1 Choline dehydrogenase [Terricaulis silvestris]
MSTAAAPGQNVIDALRKQINDVYDYIVVGSGSAGSVVAGELSKTGAEVLIIEAGGLDNAPTIANPSIWFYNIAGDFDWHLPIAPVPQLNNRNFNMALGHGVGGGSSINAMVWTRGMERDYENWVKGGAKGWSFKDVLATFKAQEDWEGGANEWRGAGGPVHIRRPHTPHPTAPIFLDAARQMGFAIHDDANGPMREGGGYINMNIDAEGARVSAARAFLYPNLDRPNLTLLVNSRVTQVLFKGDRARGVAVVSGELSRTIEARREIILSGGTVHTPKLLMQSGVGDAAALKKLGIKSVTNLRGVGKNLQDHVLLSGVVYQYKGAMPDRPADSDGVEAEVNFSSGVDNHPTDINLVLEQFPIATPEAAQRFGPPPEKDAFTIAPALIQPTSRGEISLTSADWRAAPRIFGNHLGTDRDLAAIVRAIEAARELVSQKAFDAIRAAELIPGPAATQQDLIDLARTGSASFGHAVGTCKIGADRDAVVDSKLCVHGIRGLRVADASVMPSIISGPTMCPSIMIGGRAAEFIKASK